jgi:type IV secretion system protein VirB10
MAQPGQQTVVGERRAALLAPGMSLQSRISKLLAMSLMFALGIAFLTWYYSHVAARPTRTRQGAQAQLASRAQAEMTLPSLGPIPPPPAASAMSAPAAAADLAMAAIPAPAAPMPPLALTAAPAPAALSGGAIRQTALERRLSGAAFAGSSPSATAPEASLSVSVGANDTGMSAGATAGPAPRASPASSGTADALPRLLQAEATVATRARVLPTQRLLLPKGAFIDCTLETAIDSTGRCSRARHACSCCGPRHVHRPGSW